MARTFTMAARINMNSNTFTGGMSDAIRATNKFAETMSTTDNTMGRYYDKHGRLREANGRYAKSTRDATLAGNLFTTTMRGAKMGAIALATAIGTVSAAAGAMANELDASQGRFEAMTGMSEEASAQMTALATDVYAQGWGPSITQTVTDMAGLQQVIGDMTDEGAKAFLKSGYIIEDAFQAPVAETAKVVKNLVQNFDGLSTTDAFDIITTGFQKGGDYSGDMLDTINEYSMQFAGLGMSAEQMMASLIAGSQEGAFMLDKVGDAAKEAFIRLQDGSKTSAAGFQAIGLDANKMAANIAAGGDKANSAFQATLLGLANMKDPLKREAAGVALFGTQWEDMGDSVVLAMAKGQQGLGNFSGATQKAGDALHNNLGSKMVQLKNQFMLGLANIGAPIVDGLKVAADWAIANMPMILGVIGQVGSVVGTMLTPAFGALKAVIGFLVSASPYIVGVGTALLTLGAYFKMLQMKIQIVFWAMRAWFAILAVNPVTLIAIGIGLLIGYLIQLAGGWGAVKQKLIEFLPTLRMVGSTILTAVMPILRQLGSLFMSVFNGIKAHVLPTLNSMIFGIVAAITTLVGFIRKHWTLISTIILVAWTGIKVQTLTTIALIKAIVTGGFKIIGAVITNTWKMTQNVVKAGWAIITGLFEAGLQILQGDWSGAWDTMVGMLDTVFSNVQGFFGNLKNLFYDSGRAIIDTLVDGIKSVASAPVDAISGVLDSVRQYLPFSDAKEGPLSQLTHNGRKIVTTMAEGINKERYALSDAMDNVLMRTPGGGSIPVGTANPGGSTAGGSGGSTKTVIIQKLFENLTVSGAEGQDAKELAKEVIAELVDLLGGASEIEVSGLGDLLDG